MEVGELAGIPHADLTIEMREYLVDLLLRGRARTARTLGQDLGQFARWCQGEGIRPVGATKVQIEAYQAWLTLTYRTPKGQPLARTTLATRLANLKAWYTWLDQRGDLLQHPARDLVVRVPRSRVVVREHLSLQEAIALLQTQAEHALEAPAGTYQRAIRQRNLALLAVALATGRRIGGLVSLEVRHLDAERKELRVEREKGRQGRVLPVAAWAVGLVQAYLVQARPMLASASSPWLFADRGGVGPISRDALIWFLREAVPRTIAANPDLTDLPGKTITWHSLRVTFATLLFANGCPIRSINELMLHRSLSTTARYTPIPIEDLQERWATAHPRP